MTTTDTASGRTSTRAEGGICILVGLACIAIPFIFAIGLTVLVGLCFIGAGLVWIYRGSRQGSAQQGQRSIFSLVLAAVMVVGGAIVIVYPQTGNLAIGILLLAQGAVTLGVALLQRRDSGTGFLLALAAGAAGIAFGLVVLLAGPFAQTWVLPLLVGIDLVLLGLSLVTAPAGGVPART